MVKRTSMGPNGRRIPANIDIMHEVFQMQSTSTTPYLSDEDIKVISERAISTFRMSDYIEGSKEYLDQSSLFTVILYSFDYGNGYYSGRRAEMRFQFLGCQNILRVYAIVRPKYSPPIVYRHLIDQWIRRPNPKRQKTLTEQNDNGDPYTKFFLAGFSIGYDKGLVNHTKEIV